MSVDYSQNPFPNANRPPSRTGLVWVLLGLAIAGMIFFVGIAYVLIQELGLNSGPTYKSPSRAEVVHSAKDGWLTYKFEDLGFTAEFPDQVYELDWQEEVDPQYRSHSSYEASGSYVTITMDKWFYSYPWETSRRDVSDHDREFHEDYSDARTLTTKLQVASFGQAPAYRIDHTYKWGYEDYECRVYYIIGNDWQTIVDVYYLAEDEHEALEELARFESSVVFHEMDGLVTELK